MNYVDPTATRPFDLGPCRCPVDPKPHVNDSADLVVRFPYGDRAKIRTAPPEMRNQLAILLGVKRWTLVKPDGSERPVDAGQVYLLDDRTVEALISDAGLGGAMEDPPLPKGSGATSRDGSRGRRSSTPSRRARPTSTTG